MFSLSERIMLSLSLSLSRIMRYVGARFASQCIYYADARLLAAVVLRSARCAALRVARTRRRPGATVNELHRLRCVVLCSACSLTTARCVGDVGGECQKVDVRAAAGDGAGARVLHSLRAVRLARHRRCRCFRGCWCDDGRVADGIRGAATRHLARSRRSLNARVLL